MLRRLAIRALTIAFTFILAACTAPGIPPGEMEIRLGIIEEISVVQLQSDHGAGIGAVVGGLAGLGLGSLVGGGHGRDVAEVLGAVGRAVTGNEIQKNYDQPVSGQQIIVRTQSGVLVSVIQPSNDMLYKGQWVYIEGFGEGARVVPR